MMGGAAVERPWRCFVAVPIGDELRAGLAVAVEGVRAADRARDAAFRWTEPEGWHVTLAFLGATPADRVPEIVDALRAAVVGTPPFQVTSGGLGAFPSARRARVVWYRITDAERRLKILAKGVRQALDIDDGAPFRAHLTLARARARDGAALDGELRATDLPRGEILVDRVLLCRSHLGRGPAYYETLAEVPLVADPAAPRVQRASPA
jgi:2'-5' RNA ligase